MDAKQHVKFDGREKVKALKDKIKDKIHDGAYWIVDNKELVIFLTPILVGGLTTTVKVVNKWANLRKEESLKNLYCYDRSLGHYWKLRRALSNKEWTDIVKRKNNGENLADILSELKVLK